MTEKENYADKGLMMLLGFWLLLHEKADNFVRNLIAKGEKAPPGEREGVEDFFLRIDKEKQELERLFKSGIKSSLKDSGLVAREELEEIAFQMQELKNTLEMINRRLANIEAKVKGS